MRDTRSPAGQIAGGAWGERRETSGGWAYVRNLTLAVSPERVKNVKAPSVEAETSPEQSPLRLLLHALERLADQVDRRRPEADEQRAAFRVPAFILVHRLGPDPEGDAQAHGAHRREVQVPPAHPDPVQLRDQHARRLPAAGEFNPGCPARAVG